MRLPCQKYLANMPQALFFHWQIEICKLECMSNASTYFNWWLTISIRLCCCFCCCVNRFWNVCQSVVKFIRDWISCIRNWNVIMFTLKYRMYIATREIKKQFWFLVSDTAYNNTHCFKGEHWFNLFWQTTFSLKQ